MVTRCNIESNYPSICLLIPNTNATDITHKNSANQNIFQKINVNHLTILLKKVSRRMFLI